MTSLKFNYYKYYLLFILLMSTELKISNKLLRNKQFELLKEFTNEIDKMVEVDMLSSQDPCIKIKISKILLIKQKEMVLLGELISYSNLCNSNFQYEKYLNISNLVMVYIFDESEVERIINIQDWTISINLNHAFAYMLKDKELARKSNLIEINIAIKLYISFFNKFKFKENMHISIKSHNNSEKRFINELFTLLKSSISDDTSNISSSEVDLLLDLYGVINNSNKRDFLLKIKFGGIIFTSSIDFQLDPPEVQYLSNRNITLYMNNIGNFLRKSSDLGLLINFIDDFFSKVKLTGNEEESKQMTLFDVSNIDLLEVSINSNEDSLKKVKMDNNDYILINLK